MQPALTPDFPNGELKASAAGEQGQIKLLTLSNPALRNALSPAIYAAGIEALNHADSSNEVRVVVISGEGANFCAGGNLNRLLHNRTLEPFVQRESIDGLHAWIEAIRTCRKPVIAAVEGACAGAGFSLALACDLIVASQDAKFVMAYSNVGLSPDGGGSWHLARLLPRQLATELLMQGEMIRAERLQHLGVVNRVVEAGSALEKALQTAETLAAKAPNVLATLKDFITEAPQRPLNQHLKAEQEAFVRNLQHANGGEGIAAFLEKRKAKFSFNPQHI